MSLFYNYYRERPLKTMKNPLLELLPLIVFFVAYHFGDLMLATAAIMFATLLVLCLSYLLHRKIAINPLISGALVGIFGGLTLALNDPTFIKIKPTLVNLLFASILLGGLFLFEKPLLKYLLQMAMELTEEGWHKLTSRWGYFFIFMACLNEFIWRNFSEEFWVGFKVFGMLPLSILFMMLQLPLIKRTMLQDSK
jgi:intracellular septation protein